MELVTLAGVVSATCLQHTSLSSSGELPTAATDRRSIYVTYIFVIVKVPLSLQSVPPTSIHVPEIAFPFTVPVRVSVLPPGVPDVTVNWNLPFTLPLKSPLKTKEPLSVSPDTKHDEFVANLKLLTTSVPSPFTTNEVAKPKTAFPPVSVRAAVQFPLILPELLLLEPHPVSAMPVTSNITANVFIK